MESKKFNQTDEFGQPTQSIDEMLEELEGDALYPVLLEIAKTNPFQARIAIQKKFDHDESMKWQDFNKFMAIQGLRQKATNRYNRMILMFFVIASGFIVLLYAVPYLSNFARACTLNSTSSVESKKGAY
jgi:hypothetical protein